jgi:hypothetical protein
VGEQNSPCWSAAVGAAVASVTGGSGTDHTHAVQSEETKERHDKDRATAMGASQFTSGEGDSESMMGDHEEWETKESNKLGAMGA